MGKADCRESVRKGSIENREGDIGVKKKQSGREIKVNIVVGIKEKLVDEAER